MKLVPAAESEPTSYACPMHPEVMDSEASSCPQCGMKLVPADKVPGAGEGEHEHQTTASTRARSTVMTTPMGSNGKT